MDARLVAIAGGLRGAVFALSAEVAAVGRDRSNHIWINDALVSRRHAEIRKDAESFKLFDLDSHNGTRVNGIPVRERELQTGDLISIGDALFLFLVEGEIAPDPPGMIEFDDNPSDLETTVRLRPEDALYLNPERVLQSLPPSARVARDLNAILRISDAVNRIRAFDPLAHELLKLLFEVLPSSFGAVVVTKGDPGDLEFAAGLDRVEPVRPVTVSRTIVNRVVSEGTSLVANQIQGTALLRDSESLRSSKVTAVLCVPLKVLDRTVGAIYLGSHDHAVQFDEGHLQLITAAAAIAAAALETARHIELIERENRRLQSEIRLEHNLIGESRAMRDVLQVIARVAPADSTVLIKGASGTGKELAARAVHLNSPRASKPFVGINCATLSETLLESELFGYEKGAFTGAVNQKKGKLEIADGGTVFLDEVGEMAPALQARLLRVLQEREFERLGGTKPIRIDVRIVAATNRDLDQAIRDGSFREDLFYRINVVSIAMPALRSRRDDIPLLSSYFLTRFARQCKRPVKGISDQAAALLRAYDWPGNVRELQNAIERAVVLGQTDLILPEDLPEAVAESMPSARLTYCQAVKARKTEILLEAIKTARGSYVDAARSLGIHPNNLHRLVRSLGIKESVSKSVRIDTKGRGV
jgi:Nif-specific regulatory protein